MTKVYIPNLAGHDFKPAEKYGELIYVSKGFQDKHAINTMLRLWQVALQDSHQDDRIMVTGYSHMQAVGFGLFAHMHGRINILIYNPDNKVRKYILRTTVFPEKEGKDV